MKEDRSLELQGSELKALIDAAAARILAYLESLPTQPSADNRDPAVLARSLRARRPNGASRARR